MSRLCNQPESRNVKTKEIDFDNGEVVARVVVSEANVLQGMKRSRLKFEAGEIADPDMRILRLLVYPELIAAARSVTINGIEAAPSFDDFVQLPEAFVKQWEDAAFECNPHWLPPDEDDEKKAAN